MPLYPTKVRFISYFEQLIIVKEKISITINQKILRDIDSTIDNINIQNRSQAIETLVEKALTENKVAVILAGKSENSKYGVPARYALKISHMTIIEKAVKKLGDSGFKTIYILANKETLTTIFKIIGDGSTFNSKIEYADEENCDGTAATLKWLKGKVKSTFLVAWCDIIFDNVNLASLWKQHLNEKTIATLLVNSSLLSKKQGLCGQVQLEGNKITSYIEKPPPAKCQSSIFFGGIFVAEPELLSFDGKSLEHDVFPELAKRRLLGGQLSSAEYLHVHSREDLNRVKSKLSGRFD